MNFFRLLSKLRYVAIIAVISSFFASALMFFIGGKKVFEGAYYFFAGTQPQWAPANSTPANLTTFIILSSLDSFLIALAILYFGYGIYALVIDPESPGKSNAPSWLVPKGVKDLKETLGQVIIIVLFVLFLDQVWAHLDNLTWEILVLPAATALLALALKLMGYGGESRSKGAGP